MNEPRFTMSDSRKQPCVLLDGAPLFSTFLCNTPQTNQSYTKLAVDALNACAGLADPAAEIAGLRALLEEAVNWAEEYTLGRLVDMPEYVTTARRALGKE